METSSKPILFPSDRTRLAVSIPLQCLRQAKLTDSVFPKMSTVSSEFHSHLLLLLLLKKTEVLLTPFMRFSLSPAGCPFAVFFCLERERDGEEGGGGLKVEDFRAEDTRQNSFCSLLCQRLV